MHESTPITGSMLHDVVACERRVHHDIHTPGSARDPVSAFVQMLWAGGREHEARVLAELDLHVADLRDVPICDRALQTQIAMAGPCELVLGGRLESGDLLGMPDLLQKTDQGWVAGDVKSGSPFEADGRRPRREYAVQAAFYASMLHDLELGPGNTAYVVGRDGVSVDYALDAPWDRSGRSITQMTAELVEAARGIRDGSKKAVGALSAVCKMCHWHTVCETELVSADDPTLVAGVGRAVRDALMPFAPTVKALAAITLPPDGPAQKIPGVGPARLARFRERARLLRTPGSLPYALRPLELASGHREIHFDIEADPMRDGFVYLHGFLDRTPVGHETVEAYSCVFAERETEERDAFAAAMTYLTADPEAVIYYYSKYERSSFRTLQTRYPEVCTPEEIERLFDPKRAIDLLFDIIMPATEWPTRNLSIKTLARHLGFEWRDGDAGGANSIAWFDEYARTRDPAVRQRIIDYNHDDVRASAVVLDGLRSLPVRGPVPWPPA